MGRFKMAVSAVTLVSVLLIFSASFVKAEETEPQLTDQKDVTAEKILVDVFLLRPVGVVATAFGAATYLVSLPVTLTTKSHEIVGKKLVGDTWNFTFKRPVGHLK